MKTVMISCQKIDQVEKYAQAGANEFQFVLKDSAFSSLTSYGVQELITFVDHIHQYGAMAVLMNRLFDQDQIEQACENLQKLIDGGVDLVYFADPGLLRYAKQHGFMEKMQYSPETLMTSVYDAKFWMGLGIGAVTISPLLTKEEICTMVNQVHGCSLPIHGHFLMSVSKRKLLTAYQEVSDQKTTLHEHHHLHLQETKRDTLMPVYENAAGTYIYTDYVQHTFLLLKDFIAAGLQKVELYADYLQPEMLLDALKAYQAIFQGADPQLQLDEYAKKYPSLSLFEGYYGQKTVR